MDKTVEQVERCNERTGLVFLGGWIFWLVLDPFGDDGGGHGIASGKCKWEMHSVRVFFFPCCVVRSGDHERKQSVVTTTQVDLIVVPMW